MQRLLATAAAVVTAALVVVPPAWRRRGHHGTGAERGNADAGRRRCRSATATRPPRPPRRPATATGSPTPGRPCSTSPPPTTSASRKLQYSLDNGANYIDIPITAGPSVTGTASITQRGQQHRPLPRARTRPATPRAASPPTPRSTRRRPSAPPPSGSRARTAASPATSSSSTPATNQETVKIASIVTPAPAAPAPNVTLAVAADEGARARPRPSRRSRSSARSPCRSTRQLPTRDAAGHGRQQPHRPQPDASRRPAPTRRPGSGGTAVRDTWIDGTWTYPLPLDASQLSLGKHTWDARRRRQRRQRQQGQVHVPGHDVVRRRRRAARRATARRARSRPPTSPRCARSWPRPRPPADVDDAVAAIGQLRVVRGQAARASPTPRRATC